MTNNDSEENEVCINGRCFSVEIADDSSERTRGLMYRESLDQNKGMFFIFNQEANHSFWMKDTLIPLDIIWLNDDKEVIYIERNVPSCKEDPCSRYGPNKKSKYVLEINAGQADQANIKIGHKLIFK